MYLWARLIPLVSVLFCPAGAAELALVSRDAAVEALALGRSSEVTKPDDDSALWVRLFETPASSPVDCVPETHSICAYRYVLTAVEKGEAPLIAAFDLGVLGEIITTQVLQPDAEETVRIRLLVLDRPRATALQMPGAILSTKLLDVTVGLDRALVEESAVE